MASRPPLYFPAKNATATKMFQAMPRYTGRGCSSSAMGHSTRLGFAAAGHLPPVPAPSKSAPFRPAAFCASDRLSRPPSLGTGWHIDGRIPLSRLTSSHFADCHRPLVGNELPKRILSSRYLGVAFGDANKPFDQKLGLRCRKCGRGILRSCGFSGTTT